MSNWVQRRYDSETATSTALESDAPVLWRKLAEAISDACVSFRANYGGEIAVARNGRTAMTVNAEIPADRIKRFQPTTVRMEIVYSLDNKLIAARYSDGTSADIKICVNKQGAYLIENGRKLTVDQASEFLLKSILFPL